MPNREYIRNGHLIHIDVDLDAQRRWRWSYTIDGGGYTELLERGLIGENAAMMEAENDANFKVDRMPAGDAVE
ncbi:hypothetical protein FAZ95_13980 [Trinickia violacea]|uniref:DUF1508 domain-containing protein n=1 Tax=Trinickia violacea TaxID=2571746 RepID=A0A4P8IPX2_9BURK|nr:hypothetical protein [Trinickia violacea]QCP50191.1 hypothetical protein FAZ95_13980 [Trinickia violacea]